MTGTTHSFAATPERMTGADILSDTLRAIRLTGSVFLNACFKTPVGIISPRHFDATTPVGIIRQVNRLAWTRFLESEWPESPLPTLAGKTPKQVTGDESQRVALAAALLQLDMYSDRFGLPFDVTAERKKYGLAAPTMIEVTGHSNVGVLSVLQFARLPFEKLSDSQLVAAFKRATLIQHKGSLRPLLLAIVERTSCHHQLDISRVYRFLSDIGSLFSDPSEALRWLDRERMRTVSASEQFEHDLDCDMRELRYRLDDPHTPDCNRLLRRLWEHYGTKVPELRTYVTQIVSHYKVSAPWMADGRPGLAGIGGAVTSGGVWTPDAAAENPAGESKLWLPGQ